MLVCVPNNLFNFVDIVIHMQLKVCSFSKYNQVTHKGKVLWTLRGQFGVTKTVYVEPYFIPASEVGIFEPQVDLHSEILDNI